MAPKKGSSTKRVPVKRKQQGDQNDQPQKKVKIQQAAKIKEQHVQWILPWRDPEGTAGILQHDYDETTAKRFAPLLFDGHWSTLSNIQTRRLLPAPIWSPAQKIKEMLGFRQSHSAHRLNDSSQALRRFFGRIQRNIKEENVNFKDLFAAVDDRSALLASNSYVGDAYTIDQLNSDVRVTVTLRENSTGPSTISRYFHIIRQDSGKDEPYGFFVHLPRGTRVTVNGQPVTNLGEGSRPGDFWIGPLDSFTVIELLGQPFFFWRSLKDLVYKTSGRAPTDEDRRIRFDDIEIRQNETILEVEPMLPGDRDKGPLSDPGRGIDDNPGVNGNDSSDKASGKSGADERSESRPEVAHTEAPTENDNREIVDHEAQVIDDLHSEASPGPQDTKTVEPEGQNTGKLSGRALPVPEEEHEHLSEYSDDWKSASTSSSDYVRRQLSNYHLHDANDLVRRILIGINDRQHINYGLSVPCHAPDHNGGVVLRPGRPLIVPHQQALLVIQFNESAEVSMHVLDPMAWRSSREDRDRIFQAGLDILRKQEWFFNILERNVGNTLRPISGRPAISDVLPKHAIWANTAQHHDTEGATFYTVLNAWALAMGLVLNPQFRLSNERRRRFMAEAGNIFAMVYGNGPVDWKLLLAFFRCYNFVTNDIQDIPRDRKFSLIKRDFNRIHKQQCDEDEVWHAENESINGNATIRLIRVNLPDGMPHDGPFASDSWTHEFRNDAVRTLVKEGEYDPTMTEREMRNRYNDLYSMPHSSELPPPPSTPHLSPSEILPQPPSSPPSLESNPESDLVKTSPPLPEDFQLCEYFRNTMDALTKSKGRVNANVAQSSLSKEDVFYSISAVSQAITEHQPADQGFALIHIDTHKSFQDAQPLNQLIDIYPLHAGRILLLPWTINSHTILIIVQLAKQDGNKVTIHALDSASWTLGSNARATIYNGVRHLIDKVGWNIYSGESIPNNILWVDGAQQREAGEAGYYTVLNAWSILLGLDLNHHFQPSEAFCNTADRLIRLVLAGSGDWRLIFSFLRCFRFVSDKIAPKEVYRFTRVISQSHQDQHLRVLYLRDRHVSRSNIGLNNSYVLARGQPHDEIFGSDDWKEKDRLQKVPALKNRGQFDLNLKRLELKKRYADTNAHPLAPWERTKGIPGMKSALIDRGENITGLSERDIFSQFAEAFKITTMRQFVFINQNPCGFWQVKLSTLQNKLPSSAKKPPKYDRNTDIAEVDILLAISSVLEAIMALQDDTTGLGGFTLTSAQRLRSLLPIGKHQSGVARPRRAWFMPYPLDWKMVEKAMYSGSRKRDNLSRLDHLGNHKILVIIQDESTTDTGSFKARIVDSDPNVLGQYYDEILEDVHHICDEMGWTEHRNRDGHVKFDTITPRKSQKVVGQTSNSSSGIHVVLNSWICALNLTFEDRDTKRLGDSFNENARLLIHFAQAGVVDWATIAAFLICHHLVKERIIEAVPVDRRFASTQVRTSEQELETRIDELIDEDKTVARISPDDTIHPYDHRNNYHFRTEAAIDTGSLPQQIAHGFPIDATPWEYFHARVEILKKIEKVEEWLHLLQSGKNTPGVLRSEIVSPGDWLWEDESLLSIASVTLAVTAMQPVSDGFSHLPSWVITTCLEGQDPHEDILIRSGRPMMFPLVYKNHIVLAIIQLDKVGKVATSIIDSRIWHYTKKERGEIHTRLVGLIARSNWCRLISPAPETPQSTSWVGGPQQPNSWMCGYYAVVTAWTLALGLSLNPEFSPNPEFFKDAKAIFQLARGSFADWKLIYAFLLCHDIIVEGKLPKRFRRFENTVSLGDDNKLDRVMRDLKRIEVTHWSEHAPDMTELGGSSRVLTPKGHPHNITFPSDSWEVIGVDSNNMAEKLSSWGLLNKRLNNGQLHRLYYSALKMPSVIQSSVLEELEQKHPITAHTTFPDLVNKFHDYFDGKFRPSLPRDQLDTDRAAANPCSFYESRSSLLHLFLVKYQHRRERAKIVGLPEFGKMFSDDQVTLAIASVVEALDSHQAFLNTDDVFRGGLALATSININLARGRDSYLAGRVMRPRRCWLMPWVVDGEFMEEIEQQRDIPANQRTRGGHTFLVLVQEESRVFKVSFFDSAPKHFEDARVLDFMHKRVYKVAQDLQWSTERNEQKKVDFDMTCTSVRVAPQGSWWTCGLHTVLNAWILAMGLKPNPSAVFNDAIYRELYGNILLAVTGLMDWKTLAAWLLCRDLVVPARLGEIPEHRRFSQTQIQTDETDLNDRIMEQVNDDLLFTLPELTYGYDYSSNVDFTNDVNSKGRGDENVPLSRGYSIVSNLGPVDEDMYLTDSDVSMHSDSSEDWSDVGDGHGMGNIPLSRRYSKTENLESVDELMYLEDGDVSTSSSEDWSDLGN